MEKAVLIGIITPQQPETKAKEYIEELAFPERNSGSSAREAFFSESALP